jgi:hypothetical protein
MQYSEHNSMHISFFGIFFIGAIVLFVVVPMIRSLVKGPLLKHPAALLMAGGALAILLFAALGLMRVPRVIVQSNSAVQYSPEVAQTSEVSPSMPLFEQRFSPVWRKMLILGLLLAVPIIMALRFAHRRHWHTHLGRHGLFGLPLVLIALALFFWTVGSTSVETPAPPIQTAWQVERSSVPPNQHQNIIPVSAQEESRKSKPSAEKEAEVASTAADETTAQPAENPDADKPAPAEKLPDWVLKPQQANDDVTYKVVHIDGISDPALQHEQVDSKLKAIADVYIDDVIFRQRGASAIVALPADYLRKNCKVDEYESRSGSGDIYIRLKFDSNFRTFVERRYHAVVAQDHLQQLGAAGAVAFAALGGLYVFLRAAPTNGKPKSANADAAVSGSTT